MSEKNSKKKNENKKEIIDLTSYLNPDIVNTDPNGSYTGVPSETFYDDELVEPIQDADDL